MSHPYIVAQRWNLYINRSFLPFSFVSFFLYATTCLPACLPAFVFGFVSLFCLSISPLALVAILLYIHTNISVPALVLPKRVTLYLEPFVTLCCVNYCFRNTCTLRHHVYTIKYTCTRTPTIYRRRRKVDQTSRLSWSRPTPPTRYEPCLLPLQCISSYTSRHRWSIQCRTNDRDWSLD